MAYARLTGPNGSHLIRMIIDTGANATVLPREALLAIGCDPETGKRAPMATANGIINLQCLSIPSLSCLGETIRNLEVLCHTLPAESSAQGVLGLDFLCHVPAYQQFEQKIRALTHL